MTVADLEPVEVLDRDIVGRDGVTMLCCGDELRGSHIQLMRAIGIQYIYAVDGPEAAIEVRNQYNMQVIPILNAMEQQTITESVEDPRGALLLPAGHVIKDKEELKRLFRLGIERITVHAGTAHATETRLFNAGKKRIAERVAQAKAMAVAEPSNYQLTIIETFKTSWIDVCQKFVNVDFLARDLEKIKEYSRNGDYEWSVELHGDELFQLVITIQKECGQAIACSLMGIDRDDMTFSVAGGLLYHLVSICLENVGILTKKDELDLEFSQLQTLWDSNGTNLLSPTLRVLSQAFDCEMGWITLQFGDVAPLSVNEYEQAA